MILLLVKYFPGTRKILMNHDVRGRQPNRRDRNVKDDLTNAASHEPPFRFHDALKSRSNRNPPSLWTCRGSMIMGE